MRASGRASLTAYATAIALLALPEAANAFVDVVGNNPNVTVTYYEVTSADADDIIAEIKRLGPGTTPKGERAAGATQTSFEYSIPTNADGTCDLSEVEVTYKVAIRLPKLAPNLKLRSNTGQWWLMMIDALTRHELDHVKLSIGYRDEMQKAIRAATCDTAHDEAERVQRAFSEANARYDKITDHGTWVPSGRVRKR